MQPAEIVSKIRINAIIGIRYFFIEITQSQWYKNIKLIRAGNSVNQLKIELNDFNEKMLKLVSPVEDDLTRTICESSSNYHSCTRNI